MPCTKCEEGNYKWGKTGECKYDTLESCESANSKYNKMRPTPLGKKSYEEYAKELKEFNLSNEKIELASVKELSKMINEFKSSFDKAVSAFDKIDNVVKAVAKPINKAQSLSVDIDREYKQFKKQAKELGVDIPNIIENGVKDVKKLDSSLESMGNKVKAVEKA
jgi:methyl-accepting chemotaxis protein